jgi:hypothetical protein
MIRVTSLSLGLLAALTMGCGPSSGADCDPTADADADGLDDCTERLDLGTDPNVADSDLDGFDDGMEIECGSDPLDGDEVCYACGWRHDDPGNLVSTGAGVGDVVENLGFFDQCEEHVQLWDFAREYHVLFLTASW